MPYVVTAECIVCGACASGCENNAITEGETQSYIDPNICVECGTCEANCPVQAIIYVEESEMPKYQESLEANSEPQDASKQTPDT